MYQSNVWSIAEKERHNCPSIHAQPVYISTSFHKKVEYLMGLVKSKEWFGYVIGKDKGETVLITDIIIPKQRATVAAVDDIEYPHIPQAEHIIGTIHSHHSFGSFFSGVDSHYLVGNHRVNIVVSHNGYVATLKVNAPCGGMVNMESNVLIEDYHKVFDKYNWFSKQTNKVIVVGLENLIEVQPYKTPLARIKVLISRYINRIVKRIKSEVKRIKVTKTILVQK